MLNVTLRSGRIRCFGTVNELQIIDVTDIDKPKVVSQYSMVGLYGLAIKNDMVFVCDGDAGLKVVNVADKEKPRVAHRISIPSPRDIILQRENRAIVVSTTGIHQYDISDVTNVQLISTI